MNTFTLSFTLPEDVDWTVLRQVNFGQGKTGFFLGVSRVIKAETFTITTYGSAYGDTLQDAADKALASCERDSERARERVAAARVAHETKMRKLTSEPVVLDKSLDDIIASL